MVLSRAARALRAVPHRSLAARRMCTAVADAAPPSGLSLRNPEVVTFVGFVGTIYLGALRWAVKDKALEKKKAALSEAHAHTEATEQVAAEVAPVVPTEPAAAAPVVVAAAPAPLAAVVAAPSAATAMEWKVNDVVAWLSTLELQMHADSFKSHAVDGKLLLSLDEQELYKVLNIVSPLHRKKLMMGIAELRAAYLNP